MARRKTSTEHLEDTFYDLSYQDQTALLATLQTLHRLKGRQPSKRAADEPEEPPVDGVAK